MPLPASGRRSRASSASTRSCPTARSATRPTSASSRRGVARGQGAPPGRPGLVSPAADARRGVARRRHPQGLRRRRRRGADGCDARAVRRRRRRAGWPEWDPDELDAFVAEADAPRLAGARSTPSATRASAWPSTRTSMPRRRTRAARAATAATASSTSRPSIAPTSRASPVSASSRPCSRITPTRRRTRSTCGPSNIGPDRAGQAWSWSSIRRAGGVIAFGSDWPSCRSTRSWRSTRPSIARPMDGHADRRLALRREAVAARGALRRTGTVRRTRPSPTSGAGRSGWALDADLVVLDRDMLAGGPSAIIGTTVALTVVGGEVVHRSEGFGERVHRSERSRRPSRSRSSRTSCPRSTTATTCRV